MVLTIKVNLQYALERMPTRILVDLNKNVATYIKNV